MAAGNVPCPHVIGSTVVELSRNNRTLAPSQLARISCKNSSSNSGLSIKGDRDNRRHSSSSRALVEGPSCLFVGPIESASQETLEALYRQGSKEVVEYVREFEQLKVRTGVRETEEHTIARFMGGLNSTIVKRLELQPIWTFEEACKMVIPIEKQLKKKSSYKLFSKPTTPVTNSVPVKASSSKDAGPVKGKFMEGTKDLKGKKCFKCHRFGHFQVEFPNLRALTLKEVQEMQTEAEYDGQCNYDDDGTEEELVDADVGEMLVIRRVLHTKEVSEDKAQRKNIFHSRCTIKGKVCNLIVDGGSCANVASTYMVEKLGLPTTKHPCPYKLQWLSQGTEARDAYYGGKPLIVDDMFDRVELKLRWYGSKYVVKYPRCSLRQQSTYADAEEDPSQVFALASVWLLFLGFGSSACLVPVVYTIGQAFKDALDSGFATSSQAPVLELIAMMNGILVMMLGSMIGYPVASASVGALQGLWKNDLVAIKGACPNCGEEVFAFVRSNKFNNSPHKAECHVCECLLEFRTKVERSIARPGKRWVYGRIYLIRRRRMNRGQRWT